ncbi:MAG: protein kinase domain-containing protein [Vicinamibacterales bacterium]
MPIAKGDQVGPYRVVGWLGAGGMGEVYRARDPRLGRDVAIKLIPEAIAADANRVRRFEQEARAAGQLNHPNVLVVYDVGHHDGAPFIVSELLEGESLRSRLHAGAMSLRKAVDYARQTAEGLAAAHDRHIIHRDVKPDNLFVTSEGRIKILDFGIAKLSRPGDEVGLPAGLRTDTDAGMILGSAGYMSPEQVRGEPVDARSDLFSVGTILYEMLAGHPAFARGTAAETMAAILNEDPQPLPAPVSTPLIRIVSRCLEKSPEARFQSARDLAFSLDVLQDTTAHPAIAAQASSSLRSRWALGIGFGVLIVAAAVAGWRTPLATPPHGDALLANATFTPFTDWDGTEALAAISPDGRFVAFLSDRDGQFDIWLSQVGTGEFRNLTTTIPSMSPPGIVLRDFGFSGDGSKIWFSLSGNPGDRKMLMSLLGGKPGAFLGEGDVTPSWSPDAMRLAFVNNRGGDPLFVADAAGADARRILAPEDGVLHNHDPVWSPDGEWIYFVRGLDPTDEMDVWRLRSSGGSPERLTTLHAAVNFLAPIDSHTLLYVARAEDRSGPWLWALDVATKATRRVSWGLEQYTSVAASRDGRRIVATVAHPTGSLWTVPILDRPADDDDARRYPVATVRALAPRVSGTSLFYRSAGGRGDSLWRFDAGVASEVWKGADGTLSEPPSISPDGRHMAVVVSRRSKRQLTIMAVDGTNARTVAASIEMQGATGQSVADWSRDGVSLVAGGSDEHGSGLFRISAETGTATRLTTGQATNPVRSPDGRLIVYAGPFMAGQTQLLAIRPDGTPVKLPSVNVRQGGYRFLPDGTGLVYMPSLQSRDFWLLDLASGKQRQLARLGDYGRVQTFDITPDGKHIVFDRSRENSDIVLIDLPK